MKALLAQRICIEPEMSHRHLEVAPGDGTSLEVDDLCPATADRYFGCRTCTPSCHTGKGSSFMNRITTSAVTNPGRIPKRCANLWLLDQCANPPNPTTPVDDSFCNMYNSAEEHR